MSSASNRYVNALLNVVTATANPTSPRIDAPAKSDSQLLQPILNPGTIINRVFEIERVLGTGNVGTVYLCRHLGLHNRKMAVKVIGRHLTSDPDIRRQFIDEINATYEVSHRNVVRTFEYFDDGTFCGFSMEYVSGGDLLNFVAKHHPISFTVARKLLIGICNGLEAIHEAGIVHRDVKPENVLITEDLKIKIADFGIATHLDRSRLATSANLLGALDYMSPEYIRDGSFDTRSDIYSVGALAFKLLSGRAPFEGYDPQESLQRRVKYKAKSLSEFRPECPEDLVLAIAKALARDPEQRYRTIAEFRRDLEVKKVAAPQLSPAPSSPTLSTHSQIKVLASNASLAAKRRRSRPAGFVLLAASLVVLAFVYRNSPMLRAVVAPAPKLVSVQQAPKVMVPSERPVEVQFVRPVEVPVERPVLSSSEDYTHTVQFRGETLSIIAGWYTGNVDNWRKLAKANPVINPNLVSKGQAIIIPHDLLMRVKPMPITYVESFEKQLAESRERASHNIWNIPTAQEKAHN